MPLAISPRAALLLLPLLLACCGCHAEENAEGALTHGRRAGLARAARVARPRVRPPPPPPARCAPQLAAFSGAPQPLDNPAAHF
jgi:hypothetical protein